MASSPEHSSIPTPLYRMAKTEIFRRYILDRLQEGGRIPPDRQLASELNVSRATLAKALHELLMEGYIRRYVGSGTYVIPATTEDQAIGIYYGGPIWDGRPMLAIYDVIDRELQKLFHRRHRKIRHYIDMRIPELQGEPLPLLMDDIEAKRLSALLVVRARPSEYHWLRRLSIPVAAYGFNYSGSAVFFATDQFSRQAVEYLATREGCATIGLIAATPREAQQHGGVRIPPYGYNGFLDGAARNNATIRENWIFTGVMREQDRPDPERFGYERFRRLWMQAGPPPEGLVVFTDIVALGVVRAARELGLELGRDLKMIVHANEENPWPLLKPFPKLIFSVRQLTQELWHQVHTVEAGKPGTCVWIGPALSVPHAGVSTPAERKTPVIAPENPQA